MKTRHNRLQIFKVVDHALYEKALYIRMEVFVKEQGVPQEEECDPYEEEAEHYLAYYDDHPAGTARWRETPKGIKLERFAVLTPYRGKGVATRLLEHIMHEIVPTGKKVYLHAQLPVTGFYEKNGFRISGKQFTEAGIRHFKMVYSPIKS